MPTKYSIPSVYEAHEGCALCGGTGMLGSYVGVTSCPNCRDWLRDEEGRIASSVRQSTGEIPSFRTELMQTTHGPLPSQRHYADAATPSPPQVVNRRPVNTGRAARRR